MTLRPAQRFLRLGQCTVVMGVALFLHGARLATAAPVITIGDASALEPPWGNGQVGLLVSVSEVASDPVTVDYQTYEGTAGGLDFEARNGTLEIPAGDTRAWIWLTIRQDSLAEEEETFTVQLAHARGASVGRDSGRVSVLDAGARPIISADQATLYEDGPGTVGRVVAHGTVETPIEVAWQLHEWTGAAATLMPTPATAGADFMASRSMVQLDRFVQFRMAALSDTEREPALTTPIPEVLSLSVEATRPAAYATFAPVQILPRPKSPGDDNESLFRTTATTDGKWIVCGRASTGFTTEEPPPQVLDLWRRSPLDRQHWDPLPGLNLTALNQNRPTGFIEMRLRRERLALQTNLGLLLLAPAEAHGTDWSYAGLVPFPPSLGGDWDFDGDTLLTAQGFSTGTANNTRVSFYERLAPSAHWALVSQHVIPNDLPLSVTVNGDLALVSMVEKSALLQWKRNGSPSAPWIPADTFPGASGARYINLALGNAVLFAAEPGNLGSQKPAIFTSPADGQWQPETTHPDAEFLLNLKAFEVTRETVNGPSLAYTRLAESGIPWHSTPERILFDASGVFSVSAVDAQHGVLLHRLLAPDGASGVIVSTGGAHLQLVDDEDFLWTVGHQFLENIQYPEPASGPLPTDLALRTSRALPFPVSVRVRTVPTGSATPGVDYVPFDRRLFMPANADQTWLGLTVLGDLEIENPETFKIEMLEPSYGRIDSPSGRTITLLNRVHTVVSTPKNEVALFEPDTASSIWPIPFHLSASLPTAVSFPVIVEPGTATPGTATPGSDYSVVQTTLDFPAGQRTVVLPVRVFADTLAEPAETFRIRLGPAAGIVTSNLPAVLISLADRFPGNESMVAPDTYTIAQNGALSAGHPGDTSPGLLANDPGQPEVARLMQPPGVGQLVLDGEGRLTFEPPSNFLGVVRFTYEAASRSDPITLIDAAAAWRYFHPLNGVNPATATPSFDSIWHRTDFDDSTWILGAGLMGYGGLGGANGAPDTGIGTPPVNARFSAYFRHVFSCPTPGTYDLTLEFSCDDAAIFYVNGGELGRFAHNVAPQFLSEADRYSLLVDATAWVDGTAETALHSITFRDVPLAASGNVLAVSVHNGSPQSSDLAFRLKSLQAREPWSSPAAVEINVADAMLPPVLAADAYDVQQNQVLDSRALAVGGLFANDHLLVPGGPAFDPILEATASPPSSGSIDLDPQSGEFRYTPASDYFGPASFTYRVRDKDGWSAPAVVTLTVRPNRSFDVWRQQTLGTMSSDDDSGPNGDPDGNGLTHLEEFFFGWSAGGAQASLSPTNLERTASGAPSLSFPFTTSHTQSLFPNDIDVVMESSTSLEPDSWNPEIRWEAGILTFVQPEAVIRLSTAGPQGKATIDASPFQAPPRYYRLKLHRSPP